MYEEAYRLSCERLIECDIDAVCQNTKAVYSTETNTWSVRYFGEECRIRHTGGSIFFESPKELDVTEKVLVLHYLIFAKPAHLTGRLVSFSEIPNGGAIYYDTFKKRSIDPLVKIFSGDPKAFAPAAGSIGGRPESFGDVSVVVPVFPLVPVTYVIWQGDDEIGPNGTILFDSSVESFLPAEDIVVAASVGTYRMLRAWKNREGT
jgi:hypothetical protein